MPPTAPRSHQPNSKHSGRLARLSEAPAALFVYGSLLFPDVRAALFQRQPLAAAATGDGWRVAKLKDRNYPGLVTADRSVEGLLLTDLSAAEWRMLDAFEDELYDLQELTLADGQHGWAYVCDQGTDVEPTDWDAQLFASRHLARYVIRCASWREDYTAAIGSDADSVAG